MEIRFSLLPKQKEFVACRAPHPAFIGGFASGKTHAACVKALVLAASNPGLPGLFVEKTFRDVDQVAIPIFKELLDGQEIPYRHYQSTHKTKIVLPKWGSEIWMRGADKPESLMGPNVAWAGIDEIARTKREVWGAVVSRARHPRARTIPHQTFAVGTPDAMWVAELWTGREEEGYFLFHTSTHDNPFIPDSYIRGLVASHDPDALAQVIYGKFAFGGRGRAYKFFSREENWREESPFGKGGGLVRELPLCLACDFNIDPCVWLVLQHRGGEIYVADEIVLRDTTTREMIDEAVRRGYLKHPSGVVVYGDPAGRSRSTKASRSDYEQMRAAGFRRQNVARAAPGVKDRVAAVNARLLSGDGKRRLFVNPECKVLTKDLEYVKWKTGTSGGVLDKGDAELTHASDALGYFVHREYPIRRPRRGPTRVASIRKG